MFRCKFRVIFLVVQLLSICNYINAANILACLTSASQSHHIIETTILEELANRGHNVTVLSTFPMPQKILPKTYHHIYIDVEDVDDWSILRKRMLNNETKNAESQLKVIPKTIQLIERRSNMVMKHSAVRNLMKSGQTFDLFILGYNINDMMLGLAGHFRVPSIILSTIPAMKTLRDMIGNPAAVSSTPVFSEPNTSKMDFQQRVGQFFGYAVEFLLVTYLNHFVFHPFYDKYFPASENYPSFDEVKMNVSFIMTNTHFSEGTIRPFLPNLIETGGIHIQEKPNQLPKNIQDIIDAAGENGVIVFSFGGNYKSAYMTNEKLQIFYSVFSKLKQKIIWKWESDEIPSGKPENVHLLKWLPQVDLLAQSQVQFFISHCGLGGVYEAKFHGVPILGMPIHGDQFANAKLIEAQGWAIILNFDHLNETILMNSIQEMLNNSSYRETVKKLSQLFRDRPMAPLQTAIYWIEYVIRYDGAKHMQSAAAHLNIIQKSSIDVMLFIAIVVYILIKIIVKLFKFIVRYRSLLILTVSILIYLIISLVRCGE